jgi:hypothetical protein
MEKMKNEKTIKNRNGEKKMKREIRSKSQVKKMKRREHDQNCELRKRQIR